MLFLPIPQSFRTQNFSKRGNSAYLHKVKPSAGPLFLSEKTWLPPVSALFSGTFNFGVFGTNFFRFGTALSFSTPPPEMVLSIGITMYVFLATFVRFGTILVCFGTALKIRKQ